MLSFGSAARRSPRAIKEKISQHMDAIGIIALLLAIPLSVLANLLTPTVKNWLALLSKKLTIERIAALEYELERLGDLGVASNLLFLLQRLFLALIFIGAGAAFLSLSFIKRLFSFQQGFLFVSYFFFGISAGWAVYGIRDIERRRTPKYKEKVERKITFLKSRLVDNPQNPNK